MKPRQRSAIVTCAAQLASETKADPKRIATIVCDVSSESQVEAAAKH